VREINSKIEKIDNFEIKEKDIVTLTQTNHIVEVQYLSNQNHRQTIQKLDNDRYICLATGEIKEYNHTENRSQSINSIRQSVKKIRYLINNNFIGSQNELFITLTYADNMQDTEKLYKDYEKFVKRLKYYQKADIDYICLIEPQSRGAWHIHMLMKYKDNRKAYIANETLSKLWGNGFVSVKSLHDVDNIGAYLSAYLTNIDNNKEGKGLRLYMYPVGVNIYRCSRGIKHPEREKLTYEKAKSRVGEGQLTYSASIKVNINNDAADNEQAIIISKEYYNMKRSLTQ